VYFAFDSSALSSEAVATLDNQAAWLNKNNKVNVVVQGYCDVKEGYAECDDLENTSETPTDAIELSDSDNSLETLADTMEQPVSNDKDSCAYNAVLALGERRAEAVKQYLVSQGVAADRITTVSYGKEYAFPGDTEEAYAKSRRGVTIVE
ncbi:MAG: OmpA family protein, partial [Alphaproteobacteria bacterium]|nr:OmpA family protein [Alphaproteobacteria bacterium]